MVRISCNFCLHMSDSAFCTRNFLVLLCGCDFPSIFVFAVQFEITDPILNSFLSPIGFSVTDLIKERAKDPTWQDILARMTPLQYALVLQAVQNTSKTPEIAKVIAKLVSKANKFQCDHVVEFLKNVDGWYRTSIAESLLPYCNDLTTQNKGKVLAVLSDWDGCWRDSTTRTMIQGLLDGTWCTPTS